mmetsp:Transcript_10935/g.24077  ORF Transcript_10935/g.24077 Transcript_10935/m.24077 type:complete len:80 (-) Transcript_10935:1300-1539(-)
MGLYLFVKKKNGFDKNETNNIVRLGRSKSSQFVFISRFLIYCVYLDDECMLFLLSVQHANVVIFYVFRHTPSSRGQAFL